MDLTSELVADTMVIRVRDSRIDAAMAIPFKDKVRELARGAAERVVLDLSRVGFVDSSGLGAIVATMKLLGPGVRLELAALTPNVARVFRLTRMDSVFRIHDVAPDTAHGG